jgi:hypothetical protein
LKTEQEIKDKIKKLDEDFKRMIRNGGPLSLSCAAFYAAKSSILQEALDDSIKW